MDLQTKLSFLNNLNQDYNIMEDLYHPPEQDNGVMFKINVTSLIQMLFKNDKSMELDIDFPDVQSSTIEEIEKIIHNLHRDALRYRHLRDRPTLVLRKGMYLGWDELDLAVDESMINNV